MLDLFAFLGRLSAFSATAVIALPAAGVRLRTSLVQVHRFLVGSLPIALVAGAALGLVAWLQIRGLLDRFQSAALLPSALALAVVWEFGPVSAGLIGAARIGAGLAAELSAMRVGEQIDALRVLGVSPVRRLVAPRILACLIVLPLLAIFIDYVAVIASFAAEAAGGTMTWTQYRLECLRYLRLADVVPATLKTVIFGFIVGVTGCFCGLDGSGGADSVGRAATRSVVVAILIVLLADVALVRIIQLVQG